MQIVWSKTIEKFAPQFKVSKEQMEDTYNKPDKSRVVGGTYITVKFYDGYGIMITFFMQDDRVNMMNVYKFFPDMITVDVGKADSLEILTNFMDRFGMEVDVPNIGKVKTHFDEANRKFFQGILDIEKYMAATNGRL